MVSDPFIRDTPLVIVGVFFLPCSRGGENDSKGEAQKKDM